MKDTIIALCNLTMAIAAPWLEAGYTVVMVDPQHPPGITGNGRVIKIGCTITEAMGHLAPIIRSGRVAGVFGFPPCTDVALSGTRWWNSKRQADPYFQAKAAIVAEQCRMIGEIAGGIWWFENPKSAFSKIFGTPQHKFQPYEFTAYCPADNYTKETWLWTGGGFVMPKPSILPNVEQAMREVTGHFGRMVSKRDALAFPGWYPEQRDLIVASYPDNRIHEAPPGDDRENFRSATPQGFARAVFAANGRNLPMQMELAA